ncbi:Arylsulfatase A [Lutibacter oricola]|uniref:Arylsulfatase A n=1 Tax=Lutibacter oricola TaxID=762486 RepID=A0A1H3FHE9_9FLAO|nr:sulfatase-like hydrolase/transferase [Lutibacter oricola]SDX89574.1 Arylsulfatase A [Lutibacter oricola]
MKLNKFIVSIVIIILAGNIYAQKQNKQKPNIVVVFADDISAREFPIYNSTVWNADFKGESTDLKMRAKTPVLSRLAEEGVFIKTAWAATICSPSRAMMMTGRYADKHKWWHNGDLGMSISKEGKRRPWPLYESSTLIGHIAQKAGYATMWSGKTQMKGSDLLKFGFDEGVFTPGEQGAPNNPMTDFKIIPKKLGGKKVYINADTGKEMNTYQQYGWYWQPHVRLMNHPSSNKKLDWWPNTKESKEKYGLNTFGPDVELELIFDFMERKQKEKKPFFVYHTTHLGHGSVDFFNQHPDNNYPQTPKIKWTGNEYIRFEPNVTGDKGVYNTHNSLSEPGIRNHVNYLDYQAWLYINKFKEMGIENNTIFIFCADNGTHYYGKGSPVSQKGTHVPFIVYAPGMHLTKKGEQDILVNIADVMPTIADIVGVKIEKNYEVDGVSLWPYLTTSTKKHREWIYSYKKGMQLIRGFNVMKDGEGTWYNVAEDADDLVSFPKIKDWSKMSKVHLDERDQLNTILPKYNLHATAHDAPGYIDKKKLKKNKK